MNTNTKFLWNWHPNILTFWLFAEFERQTIQEDRRIILWTVLFFKFFERKRRSLKVKFWYLFLEPKLNLFTETFFWSSVFCCLLLLSSIVVDCLQDLQVNCFVCTFFLKIWIFLFLERENFKDCFEWMDPLAGSSAGLLSLCYGDLLVNYFSFEKIL